MRKTDKVRNDSDAHGLEAHMSLLKEILYNESLIGKDFIKITALIDFLRLEDRTVSEHSELVVKEKRDG